MRNNKETKNIKSRKVCTSVKKVSETKAGVVLLAVTSCLRANRAPDVKLGRGGVQVGRRDKQTNRKEEKSTKTNKQTKGRKVPGEEKGRRWRGREKKRAERWGEEEKKVERDSNTFTIAWHQQHLWMNFDANL